MSNPLLKILLTALFTCLLTSPAVVSAVTLTNVTLPQAVPLANLYTFQGKDLQITYSTTGIDGKAHFTYQHGKKALSFNGDQIRTVGTEVGMLVSVTIVNTIDTGSTTFSLLIPKVNLDRTTHEASIKTEGIVTRHKFSVIPRFNTGQTEDYQFLILTGTAKAVAF